MIIFSLKPKKKKENNKYSTRNRKYNYLSFCSFHNIISVDKKKIGELPKKKTQDIAL